MRKMNYVLVLVGNGWLVTWWPSLALYLHQLPKLIKMPMSMITKESESSGTCYSLIADEVTLGLVVQNMLLGLIASRATTKHVKDEIQPPIFMYCLLARQMWGS